MAYALAFLVSDVITLTAVFRSFASMRLLLLLIPGCMSIDDFPVNSLNSNIESNYIP